MNPKNLIPADTLASARNMRKDAAPAEQKIWFELRNRRLGGFKFRRQRPVRPFIADFYCVEARLVVEVDGDSHSERASYDRDRTVKMERDGNQALRFTNRAVFESLPAVLEAILRECEKRTGD